MVEPSATRYWQEIPLHFPVVELDAWVVMPNHIHGILEIKKIRNLAGNQGFMIISFGMRKPCYGFASIFRKTRKIGETMMYTTFRNF